MNILKFGATGAEVELLQLALNRAGFGPLDTDGVFGGATAQALRRFQQKNGLQPDAVLGRMTNAALYPWYTGYVNYTIRQGDSMFRIAQRHGVTLKAVETANPGLDPFDLRPGNKLVVPLAFDVVPTTIRWSASLVGYAVRGITARYPFVMDSEYGYSVMGKPLRYLGIGRGERTVLYNAEHHANEWITTPVLLRFMEQLARAWAFGGRIFGRPASEIYDKTRIYIAPAVNPDGMDLVTGALSSGTYYARARAIAEQFPTIPFPEGWKANIAGTDPNLQYPAGWEEARRIKFEQGFTRPAPRDYVGSAPLAAPESRAMYNLTQELDPALTLSYHTQGNVIYWKYLDYEPWDSQRIAQCLSYVSGYAYETTPTGSGYAGYKDWFIQEYNRPGYTIECGLGMSPLPLSQFDDIYSANLGILVMAALGC